MATKKTNEQQHNEQEELRVTPAEAVSPLADDEEVVAYLRTGEVPKGKTIKLSRTPRVQPKDK